MICGILGSESFKAAEMERSLLYRVHLTPVHLQMGSLSLQLDGEIYNRGELAALLDLSKDATDAEVILEGYAKWNEGLFERINGPFALVIYDTKRQKSLLCRDRFGLRPLYYAYQEGKVLAFASEVKALLRCPWITREPDLAALQEYMIFGHVAGSRTFFRGIAELEPGHLLEVKKDTILATKREILPVFLSPDPGLTPKSATESLRAQLVKATMGQMDWIGSGQRALSASGEAMSKEGAVVFLSGGVDSSVLVALFRNCILEEGSRIITYSISLPGYDQNEWPYAMQIIDRFQCESHELPFGPEAMAEAWPRLIAFFKEPLTSTNAISWYLSARMSSQAGHLQVFSGEGADGLFSGGLYKTEIDGISKGDIGEDQGVIFCKSHVLNHPALIKGIMGTTPVIEERERIWDNARKRHIDLPVEYAQIAYQMRTTGNRLLTRVERMASANGVSLLLPYMDNEVVRLILSTPYEVNNRDGIKKYPLKKIGEALFGGALSFRRKVGFPFPIRGWLRDRKGRGVGELVEMLLEKRTLARDIYREKVFKKEIERRVAGEVKPMDWLLWSAINLELWLRLCVENYNEDADDELS